MSDIQIIDSPELSAAKDAFHAVSERDRVVFHVWVKRQVYGERYRKTFIPSSLRWSVFKRDGMKCRYCGSDTELTCDHNFPESLGGATEYGNLLTCCGKCNSSKGAKISLQFAVEKMIEETRSLDDSDAVEALHEISISASGAALMIHDEIARRGLPSGESAITDHIACIEESIKALECVGATVPKLIKTELQNRKAKR